MFTWPLLRSMNSLLGCRLFYVSYAAVLVLGVISSSVAQPADWHADCTLRGPSTCTLSLACQDGAANSSSILFCSLNATNVSCGREDLMGDVSLHCTNTGKNFSVNLHCNECPDCECRTGKV
eukprot:scpid92416/ scgid5845/ 